MKMHDWHGKPIDAYKATHKERIHETIVLLGVALLALLCGAVLKT